MFSTSDTIVAIATPHGHGGIGVIRVAGPGARGMVESLTHTTLEPRRATFARLKAPEPDGAPTLDQVVVTFFEGPHSYTGDDVIELSGHGSPVILRQIVIVNEPNAALQGGQQLIENPPPPETVQMAAILLATLPILFVYPFLQKFFVKGVMLGSVKE